MPFALDNFGDIPRNVRVCGKDYQVAECRMKELFALRAFAAKMTPAEPVKMEIDPEQVAEALTGPFDLAGVPKEVAERHLAMARGQARAFLDQQAREARAEASPAAETGEGLNRIISTPEGVAEIVFLALNRLQPDITRDQAAKIADDMTYLELGRLVGAFMGGGDPEADDPKAPVAGGDSPLPPNLSTIPASTDTSPDAPAGDTTTSTT